MEPCAVEGCQSEGHPARCFYDDRYHHHGRIHYNCGYPTHSVTFREDGWYLICDEHYTLLKAEREAFSKARREVSHDNATTTRD